MSRLWPSAVRNVLAGEEGFTLVEVLVAVGIMMIVGTALVGTLYQMNTVTARGSAQLVAEADLRTSMRWLAKDLRRTSTTDLVDGAAPVSCATVAPNPCVSMDWTDEYQGASISHAAAYALVGTELRRTYDGVTQTVARNVAAADISIQGKLVTVTLTAASPGWAGATRQFTHHFYIRPF